VSANGSALAVQFISDPMPAGIAFSTSDTIKGVVRALESAINDNINRMPMCLKVYSLDGSTLRATLKSLGAYGPTTTEWDTGTAESRQFADGDTLDAGYTTVLGDRLVLEVGGQVSSAGGSSVTGTMIFGASAGTDLDESEVDTGTDNPWFEISRAITFVTILSPSPDTIAFTGHAPTAAAQVHVAAGSPAAIQFTGHAPTLVNAKVLSPGPASIAFTGHAPTLKNIVHLTPAPASVTFTGHAPVLVSAKVLSPAPASIMFTGLAPTLLAIRGLHPTPGVRIDLYARAWNGSAWVETKIGGGPLQAMYARYSEAEAEIGAFSFAMPADHPRAALLDPVASGIAGARYARIYVGGEGYVFLGEITGTKVTASPDGRRTLEATGWSSARELVRLKTGYGFTIVDETMDDAVDLILAGTGWTRGTIDTAALASYSLELNGASRFSALTKLAEIQGFLLRFNSTTRTVDMGALATNPAGVRFTAIEGPISPRFRSTVSTVIPIAEAQLVSDSEKVVNKVRIIGQLQGVDGDDLTMAEATLDTPYVRQSETGPDGREIWFIEDAASVSAHGPFEEDLIQRDIRILGTALADRQRAANTLYGAAVTFLLENKDPLKTYAIRPVGMRHLVEGVDIAPIGGKYPVWYRGWRLERAGRRVWCEVDADLYLLRRERSIEASGRSTWSLGWSTTTREMPSEGQEVAQRLNELKAAVAARVPTVTWGGNPPVGRLTPSGIEFAVPDDSGVIGASERKLSWFDDESFADLRAHLFAAYNAGLDTSYFVQALKSALDGQFRWGFHDFSADWDSYMVLNLLGGGFPDIWALYSGSTPLLSFYQSGGRYKLGIWNGTSLAEVGNMKTANTGQYLIPTLGTGNAVRSGNGAYGSWSGLAPVDSAAPGFASATSSTLNVPGGSAAVDDLLLAFGVAHNQGIATPTGWTQLAVSTNGTTERIYLFGKKATGSEGSSVSGFTNCVAGHMYKIPAADWDVNATLTSVVTVATAAAAGNPDPAAGTPAYVGRFLTIAAAAEEATLSSFNTTAPSNYSGFQQANGNSAGQQVAVVSAYRPGLNTNTENPGTFSGGTVTDSASITVTVMAAPLTAEAAYITGLDVVLSGTPGYVQVQLATGAIGAESVVGTYKVYANDPTLEFAAVIPVATATRLSCRIATDTGAANHNVTLHMLNQDDVE
ncbi:MAG: hypothetical protein IT301_15160, partial [Dehalococcoidia bacterium]|nr:hypothetical protein [Dehalococcoidia bacterium]